MNREDIKEELEKLLDGEVLFDEISRALYSTDASMYEVRPLGVVIPRHREDVINLVKFAKRNKISVHPRGGGTSISGSSIGPGVIIDFTKYMNRIIEVDEERKEVTVEPGVICGELNRELSKLGYFFPPDPSSADFCSIGGMIGHNAKGARAVKYGNTIDYVLSLDVVLANGEVITTRPMKIEGEEFREVSSSDTLEGKVYRGMERIIKKNKELLSKVPKVSKNSSGYRVERVVDKGEIDLSKIFVSAEGTLGIVIGAKLRIKRVPKYRAVMLLYFEDIEKAGRAVKEILKIEPTAVEIMDLSYIELIKGEFKEFRERLPENLDTILLVEFDGDSSEELERRVRKTEKRLVKDLAIAFHAEEGFTPEEQERIWKIRKVGYPLLTKIRGAKKMATAMDDVAVSPDKLPEYIKGLRRISKKHEVKLVMFGHAGDGNFHVYPFLNLDKEEDIKRFAEVVEENYKLAIKLGGTLAGEHGDGFAKSQFLPMAYGKLYEVFKGIKELFDQENILNPEKKVTEEKDQFIKNLRFGPDYKVEKRVIKTGLAIDSEEFIEDMERCIGCGMCRTRSGLIRMCPIFKGTYNENNSSRGKINLIRLLMAGRLSKDIQFSKEFRDVVYSCVNCKMCGIECPAGVDTSRLMLELKGRYSDKEGLVLPYSLFVQVEDYLKRGRFATNLLNWTIKNDVSRYIIEKIAKLDRRRKLPPMNRETLHQWSKKPEIKSWMAKGNHNVAYFTGLYANYNDLDLGKTAIKVLKKNDCKVVIPEQRESGIASISYGNLERAKSQAEFNVNSLTKYVEKGYKIVCTSPSETLALKKEYLDILGTNKAELVAESTKDIMEFLLELHNNNALNKEFSKLDMNRSIVYYPPCHIIAQKIGFPSIELMKLIPGLRVNVLKSGCCGIAGTFGMSKENFDLSISIGEELFNEIRNSKAVTVATECEACKMQIEQGTGVETLHPLQLIGKAYGL